MLILDINNPHVLVVSLSDFRSGYIDVRPLSHLLTSEDVDEPVQFEAIKTGLLSFHLTITVLLLCVG